MMGVAATATVTATVVRMATVTATVVRMAAAMATTAATVLGKVVPVTTCRGEDANRCERDQCRTHDMFP
jgi:hypothetical protein